jgi:hypothetical protein
MDYVNTACPFGCATQMHDKSIRVTCSGPELFKLEFLCEKRVKAYFSNTVSSDPYGNTRQVVIFPPQNPIFKQEELNCVFDCQIEKGTFLLKTDEDVMNLSARNTFA